MGFLRGLFSFCICLVVVGCAGSRGGFPLELSTDQTRQWEGTVIRVTGRGRSPSSDPVEERFLSLKKAIEDAHEQLRGKIMNLQLDPTRQVRDLVAVDPERKGKIDLFIKGARITDVRFIPEKGMEVDTELRLGELFRSALALTDTKPDEKTPPLPLSQSP